MRTQGDSTMSNYQLNRALVILSIVLWLLIFICTMICVVRNVI